MPHLGVGKIDLATSSRRHANLKVRLIARGIPGRSWSEGGVEPLDAYDVLGESREI